MFVAIGKRTTAVVALHFLAMKIVTLIVVWNYHLPIFCVAAFPNLYGFKGLWWIAYTVIGVGIPVILNVLCEGISACLSAIQC